MSSPNDYRSPFVRFLDAFLQEENIKWILGVGVCILLGSSLRLVTMHWDDCTPAWKYLILLGYTGIVFPLGELSYHRLGLRKTGTVLMALTVLLIPLSFFALHWVRPHEASDLTNDLLINTGLTALLGVNLLWSTFAAYRVFLHFLKTIQPTFMICYLILCLAGAIVPGLPTAWAPILALALWAVFAAGAVKVNRHVFWLTEEHQLPRIFGFFPILLLGSQFAAIFAFTLIKHLSLAWIGFFCTLIALPILMTADAVARVFEARTGCLVRPIPWSISGPLTLGTILCAAGVLLSLTDFPHSSAAVPTATLAALAMAIVAHRTRNAWFAWGMVVCVIVAYQTSPVFFKELVAQIRDQAARAVNESRLPYAFYGLTYAPLIMTFSIVATALRRRGIALFANPLQKTASVLPWVLFATSFTHRSAVLPVAVVLCLIFLCQAALFRQRAFLIASAMAFLAGAYGIGGFCDRVFDYPLTGDAPLLIWTVATGLLLFPGNIVDRWSRSMSFDFDLKLPPIVTQNLCQFVGLLGLLFASLSSLERLFSNVLSADFTPKSWVPILIVILLGIHAVRWLNPGIAEWSLILGSYQVFCIIVGHHITWDHCVTTICLVLIAQWLLSYFLERRPYDRIAKTFSRPMANFSSFGMSILFCLLLLNWVAAHFGVPIRPWTTAALVLMWALDAARRWHRPIFTALAWSSVVVFSSATITNFYGISETKTWWPTIWSITGLILVFVEQICLRFMHAYEDVTFDLGSRRVQFHDDLKRWLSPIGEIALYLFLAVTVGTLTYFSWPSRIAGMIALVGLGISARFRQRPFVFALTWPLLNYLILASVATAFVTSEKWYFEFTPGDLAACDLPVAALAGVSIVCFYRKRMIDLISNSDVINVHQNLLASIAIALLGHALVSHARADWQPIEICLAGIAWISIAISFLKAAIRTQSRENVWSAELIIVAAFIYFTIAGVWNLSDPAHPYVCLFSGIGLWSLGQVTESHSRYRVISSPSQQTGFWLPLLVVPFVLLRQFSEFAPLWAGGHLLPLFGAATFYFWRGMVRRQIGTTVVSMALLNLATTLLWNELHWTDPQLFMIPIGISIMMITELLNPEIPAKYHEPLRFSGALMILVSPTFQMVGGSWQHIFTLLISSLLVGFLAIGLRVRILLYTSTAFLLADLVALVARGTVDHPNLLWIVGVGIGASVIAIGAACENNREIVLCRLRGLAAELELWH